MAIKPSGESNDVSRALILLSRADRSIEHYEKLRNRCIGIICVVLIRGAIIKVLVIIFRGQATKPANASGAPHLTSPHRTFCLAARGQRRQKRPRSDEQEIGDGNPSRETHHFQREAANVWHPADQVPREREGAEE